MPNKPTHDVSITILIVIVFITGTLSGYMQTVLSMVIGMLAGIFLTPDLDLAERRFGFWTLYGKLFKHRGISHTPIVGTLTRLLYLLWLPLLIMAKYGMLSNIPWNIVGLLFAGLCIADILHVTLDKIVTTYKTRRYKWH